MWPHHSRRDDDAGYPANSLGWDNRILTRHATRILDLAHAVLRGEAAERGERRGAERPADMGATARRSGLALLVERARQRAADRPRRERAAQRRARGQGVVREAMGFEPLLTGQQRDGSGSQLPDHRCTGGERVETGAALLAGGACLGAAGW